ncbi:hypothetical protein GCM10007382_06210 [Salinibacterium xinjiangense]|uniref:Lipoprotein n=1 Tax=Salinibacterium xinjiangense TaxID=386302 RepID=A0A2C8ZIT2_9MICO|nr:hypothetical protein [Salinibacterium xinjiangense]GGK89016.1 hypothetical protein GCM10007382_06210 [Salinibacterium xinjiangense]SOE64621.1 hypothetical protein SAMN06296378_1417 [Salinibacterium xinjiangense]
MRALTTIAAAAIGALLLSGCLPQQPIATPPPEATAAPIFASDEEALAAATEAYAAYLAMSDLIAADGGANPERLELFVTADQQASASDSFSVYQTKGLRAEGISTFDAISLVQVDQGPNFANIDLYLCLDVSKVRVIDETGSVVTPDNRPDRLPLEIGFEADDSVPTELKLARSEPWSGVNFC